ncbi:hypothetical protein SteCoe_10593 [Stentor coeruleus]|uniref:chitin synthase n=1 Tax=Stentor coeruleus TaxID=5963 RepID=A0A1R2CF62_9CILI|nr:hypothetical protein SteCoe_10593 [Stentor coeruleus]
MQENETPRRSSRTIVTPVLNLETQEFELNQKPSSASKDPIFYQPVKLTKEYEIKTNENNQTYTLLKKATGIECIEPDVKFLPGTILGDLKYIPGSYTKCDFLIEVSMYNEGVKNFTDTLGGICQNLDSFAEIGINPSRIACIIIVDGIRPFYSTFIKQKNFFQQFFDEERIKERFNVTDIRNCKMIDEKEEDEFAHCFMQKICLNEFSKLELQLIFCVKQKNKRKLNTHLWFFGGFCEFIQPKFVMLIDVGTMPLAESLFLLYEAMETQSDLAGCCGEIRPMDPNIWKLVVPAQVVEYRFSHIFDKALESFLGYITVLPGAFSAYRWEALQGEPLWKDYFKSICHPELMNAFNSNIYLAEDRVLCLSLISKKNSNYLIRYVKASIAETDVPENISTLMSQRRRWINGSWFSLIDSLRKCSTIFQSSHNKCRKCIFSFQMGYYVVTVIFTWVMVGNFFLVFSILVKKAFGTSDTTTFSAGSAIILVYFLLLLFVFVLALGVKPAKVDGCYKMIACIFGVYMMGSTVSTIIFVSQNVYQEEVIYAIAGSAAIFAIITFINCSVMIILKGIFHYLFLTPTYVNIFLIYAICNTHDCTWGNRPDLLTAEEKQRTEEFEEFRTKWTIVWVLCNSAFAYFLQTLSNSETGNWYVYSIGMIGLGILALRFFGAVLYVFHEACCKKKLKKIASTRKIAPLIENFPEKGKRGESVSTKIMSSSPEQTHKKRKSEIKLTAKTNKDDIEPKYTHFDDEDSIEEEKNVNVGLKVDKILAEEKSIEEISELSIEMRQRRFKHGVRLSTISKDSGIDLKRLRSIEEGKCIPTDDEKKLITKSLISHISG